MKDKKYNVYVKILVETELKINAQSLEEALDKARKYKVKDVVDFDSDFIDGNISVIGIFNDKE